MIHHFIKIINHLSSVSLLKKN